MPFPSFRAEGVPFNLYTSANDPNTVLTDLCIVLCEHNLHISTYQTDRGLCLPYTPQQSECDRSSFCSSG